MGVGDGTEVACGIAVGAAVDVERLVVVTGDAPQPARKHRLRITKTEIECGFIKNLHCFSSCREAIVTNRSESSS